MSVSHKNMELVEQKNENEVVRSSTPEVLRTSEVLVQNKVQKRSTYKNEVQNDDNVFSDRVSRQ